MKSIRKLPRSVHPRRPNAQSRRGKIIVLTAFLLVGLLGMIAFAVDVGYIGMIGTELQASVDASALAGAGELVNGTGKARQEAIDYLSLNKVGLQTLKAKDADIEFGMWDTATRTFKVQNNSPNAIRVTATAAGQPMFFGRVFGHTNFSSTRKAIAVYQPRDIAMVLDYSGSMCFDSQFRNISLLGRKAIEDNLLEIYNELGKPKYGSLTFKPVAYGNSSTSASNVKKNFGLDKVPYPYPGGSWDEYIYVVQNDPAIKSAGYQNSYGYMTWLNYVLAYRNGSKDSPGLWKVSEQPVTALKDSVDVFLGYLGSKSTDDQVSLTIYSGPDQTAILEKQLTRGYGSISAIVRQRQAGHYVGGTNISAGMNKGRLDLQQNGRKGALQMMLLMTDGVVTLPTGNSTLDKQLVLKEAQACADARIPVVTIALGAYADKTLMQQVADMTGGQCFIVPGGQPIKDVEKDLEEVFSQVAADRPLQLVQ